MDKEQKQIFSLRKLSVGLASVTIGTCLFASNSKLAKADTVNDQSNPTDNQQTIDHQTVSTQDIQQGQVGHAETEENQTVDSVRDYLQKNDQVNDDQNVLNIQNESNVESNKSTDSKELQDQPSAEKAILKTDSSKTTNNQSSLTPEMLRESKAEANQGYTASHTDITDQHVESISTKIHLDPNLTGTMSVKANADLKQGQLNNIVSGWTGYFSECLNDSGYYTDHGIDGWVATVTYALNSGNNYFQDDEGNYHKIAQVKHIFSDLASSDSGNLFLKFQGHGNNSDNITKNDIFENCHTLGKVKSVKERAEYYDDKGKLIQIPDYDDVSIVASLGANGHKTEYGESLTADKNSYVFPYKNTTVYTDKDHKTIAGNPAHEVQDDAWDSGLVIGLNNYGGTFTAGRDATSGIYNAWNQWCWNTDATPDDINWLREHEYTRTINFVDSNGKQIHEPVKQALMWLETGKGADKNTAIWTALNSNLATQTVDSVDTPVIAGYTASATKIPSSVIAQDVKQNDVITVMYTANPQSMTYKFIDDDAGKVQLGNDVTINGVTDQTKDTSLSVPENYVLADGQTLPKSYTFKAEGNDPVEIHLKHKTEDVTNSHEKDQNGNVIYDQTHEDRTYRVIENLPDGSKKTVMTINLTAFKSATKDLITGNVTYGLINSAHSTRIGGNNQGYDDDPSWATVDVRMDGYTPMIEENSWRGFGTTSLNNNIVAYMDSGIVYFDAFDNSEAIPILHGPELEASHDFYINYTANPQSSTYQFVDDDNGGATVGDPVTIKGVTDQTIKLNYTKPEGYDLVDNQPTEYTFKVDKNEPIKIHLKHHIETVTYDKPKADEKAFDKDALNQYGTRTIIFNLPEGVTLDQSYIDKFDKGSVQGNKIIQRVHFARNAHRDLITGTVTYDDWKPIKDETWNATIDGTKAEYSAVKLPVIPGYRLNMQRVPIQGASKLASFFAVNFMAIPQPSKPDDKGQTSQATQAKPEISNKPVVPNTDQSKEQPTQATSNSSEVAETPAVIPSEPAQVPADKSVSNSDQVKKTEIKSDDQTVDEESSVKTPSKPSKLASKKFEPVTNVVSHKAAKNAYKAENKPLKTVKVTVQKSVSTPDVASAQATQRKSTNALPQTGEAKDDSMVYSAFALSLGLDLLVGAYVEKKKKES